jgi:hypothetical protein
VVRPRQVGPDLPSGLRRPDRSVSLPDPRELPVQRMGGLEEFLFWSRENPRPHGMRGEPRDVSKLSARARGWVESMGFDVDDLHEPMADDLEDMAEAEIAEGDSEVEFDRRQTERTGQIAEEIVRDRLQQVEDAAAAAEAWGEAERDASVGDPGWDGFPVEEMRGLTADEAFQQHQATSGVGAMAGAGAMAGMNAARRINPNQGELPGTGGPAEEIRRQIEEARKKIPSRTPAEDAAYEKALREGGQRVPAPVVPPPVPPPVSPMEDRNPELRSMDSQMLADMMAQQATQPEQGWLGGALGGVGGFLGGTLSQMQGNTPLPYAQQAQGQLGAFQNMPTEQKLEIVLLGLAAAAAASGVGGPLVPPLLGGSALLTATG